MGGRAKNINTEASGLVGITTFVCLGAETE
jgi:hypothetical protein